MTPFSVTALAEDDLDEIWYYIAQNNPAAADRLIDTFHDKFSLLATQPLIGQARDELRPHLRSFTVGNYVIYFHPADDRILVIRVLHAARDILQLF